MYCIDGVSQYSAVLSHKLHCIGGCLACRV